MTIMVFIPMYNCEKQIYRVLEQFKDPAVLKWIDSIVCVDNRSTDNTIDAATKGLMKIQGPSRHLLRNNENYGLGGSHKVAIAFARDKGYKHLIILHGDDQGTISDMIPYLEQRWHHDDAFLMGARFMKGSRLQGYSRLRTVANHIFNIIFSVISGKRLYDLGSGLNLLPISAFKDNFHIRFADGLTFNYYLILAVAARNHTLRFFPLTWREDDQVSNAKLSRMGVQILGLLWRRLVSKKQFLAGEHRDRKFESYPSTEISRW